MTYDATEDRFLKLSQEIKGWAKELGFAEAGITDTNLEEHGERLNSCLEKNYHGEMSYMGEHGSKRYRPGELEVGIIRVISLRLNYYPESTDVRDILNDNTKGCISRYTLGRDYHKTIKKRLQKLSKKINQAASSIDHKYRIFVDSAPVMERALAEKAGLGWIGKNTMLINKSAGSYFFLAEIYTNLPLPVDTIETKNHCGSCDACIQACPTNAFESPYVLDGRKCISYLTIELKDSIPEDLRPLMGNRIFGCDDCQIVCPWNRFTQITDETDFAPRNDLDKEALLELFSWSEETFLRKTEGSAIRRTGYIGWLRNIAVALGNATTSIEIVEALRKKLAYPSPIVREHVEWALQQHSKKQC